MNSRKEKAYLMALRTQTKSPLAPEPLRSRFFGALCEWRLIYTHSHLSRAVWAKRRCENPFYAPLCVVAARAAIRRFLRPIDGWRNCGWNEGK